MTRTEPSPSLSIRTTVPSVPTSYSSSARACITAPSGGSVPPGGALAGNRQHAVHVLDREVLRAHPGDVHVDHQRIVRLVNVGRRLPFGRGDEAHRAAVGDFVEIDLELLGGVHREGARAPGGPAGGAAAIGHGTPLPRPRAPAARTAGTAPPARARRPSRA